MKYPAIKVPLFMYYKMKIGCQILDESLDFELKKKT